MALQPYGDATQLAVYQKPSMDPEEIERRQQEAEELDKKLRHIVEEVPNRTYHIMGSNAGAGSGEFHTYRHARRREQERLQKIEEDYIEQQKNAEYEAKLAKLKQEDEERTAKRRAKRQKKKENSKSKKLKTDGDGGSADEHQDTLPPSNDNAAATNKQQQEQAPIEQADLD